MPEIEQPYKGRWVIKMDEKIIGVVLGDAVIGFQPRDEQNRVLGHSARYESAEDALAVILKRYEPSTYWHEHATR